MFELKNVIFTFLIFQVSFFLGFLIGRITGKNIVHSSNDIGLSTPKKFNFGNKDENTKKAVTIDDTVFVTAVTSDSLQKIGSDIGQTLIVEDDIGSSVSKLAHLKKK